jgi:hypothetical protein
MGDFILGHPSIFYGKLLNEGNKTAICYVAIADGNTRQV